MRDAQRDQHQRRLVRPVRHIPYRRPIDAERLATAPFADTVGRLNVRDDLAPPPRRQSFFAKTSCRMCLSRLRSATSCLSLRFSSLEQLQPPQLADAEPAIDLLPAIKRLLGNPHRPDHLGHRRARLRLLQRERDLLLAVPRLLNRQLLPRGSSQGRKTLIQSG